MTAESGKGATPSLLVVAKAPIAGHAKTRLAASVGNEAAADIAAAALLDTLRVVSSLGWPVVIAMTGNLDHAERSLELHTACQKHKVIPQRGADFASRLAAAHADADAGHGIVQIGMDTPQVTASSLQSAAASLKPYDAGLGPAHDGGWWILAVRRSELAQCLVNVPTSRPDTGSLTHAALRAAGAQVAKLEAAADVDTWADACAVAALAPDTRFAQAVAAARQITNR